MPLSNIHFTRPLSNSENQNNFHQCTNFLLVICTYFGLFPLQGIHKSSTRNLKFKWKSIMAVHSVFLMISCLIISTSASVWVMKERSLQAISNFVFFFRGFLTGLLFFRLSQRWPMFLEKIQRVELILLPYPSSENTKKKLRILTGTVMIIAVVEHCLIQIDLFLQSLSEQDGNILLGLRRFFEYYSYGYMFEIVPYNLPEGIWIQFTNVNSTFSWTFLDMFICSTSLIMASKIYQVSLRVKQLISKKLNSKKEWQLAREDYSEVYGIFKEYNDIFNPFIVLSFTINIYFLLVQLFGTMKIAFTPSRLLYYIISFGLLVTRLASVCMCGAEIYERSRELSEILVTLPSFMYNDEVRIFIQHLKYSPTILSVDGYFFASKGSLLKIAGALIAYEVILIQFDKELLRS